MKKIICKNYDEMSKAAAKIVEAQVVLKPDCILGLATGSSPVGMYQELIKSGTDFSKVTTFNLDEYYPIAKDNDQSYDYFMRKNLFDHITVKEHNIPNGMAENPEEECARYDAAIEAAGGIDLQVLGIGVNGHIGFNEPAAELPANTNKVTLTESTIEANSRFFESKDQVPTAALTLGIGGIMKAKRIVVLVSGKNKAPIVRELFKGNVTTNIPVSLLQLHPDATIVMDEDAASML
ncbi:MAG: glucosamine-6-phosphate deaminase [Clostridia bacterium]|nr:glucosamine-6-phosphate deaminase [Clostridia bacterium]